MPEFDPGMASVAEFKHHSLQCRGAAEALSDRVAEQAEHRDDGSTGTGQAIGVAIGSLVSGSAVRRQAFADCMTSAGYARKGIRI